MLYITTRNKIDSFTAHKVLRDGFAPDGGQFLPIRMPQYSREQMRVIMEMPFCDVVAHVLNGFFSANLTGWDVEFAIGKWPVKFSSIGRKITVAEFWHNTDHSMNYAIHRLYRRLCGQDVCSANAKGWALIAIRIAFVFAVYAQLHQEQISVDDVAVTGADLDAMMAVWYAKKMGLPVGLILCGTNENCSFWDLLNKGQMDTGAAVVHTKTPAMDQTVPLGIERLIYEIMGREEALVYWQQVEKKETYRVPEKYRQELGRGIICSVVSDNRVADLMNSIYRTNGYFIDPYMAICYGSLQDYRARTGENRMTLIFSECEPAVYAKTIAAVTGVPEGKIKNN